MARTGASEEMVSARFGNVAGILVCTELVRTGEAARKADHARAGQGLSAAPVGAAPLGGAEAVAAANALSDVFEETWVAGCQGVERPGGSEWDFVPSEAASGSSLALLRRALACTDAPRVFIQVGPPSSATPIALEVILAAIAWPEAPLSVIDHDDQTSIVAIARRPELLDATRQAEDSGASSIHALLGRLATERIKQVDLGLGATVLPEQSGVNSASTAAGDREGVC